MEIKIEKKGTKYLNMQAAMMAFQMAQMLYASQGYLTTSRLHTAYNVMVLTVHFEMQSFPAVPVGYTYSKKVLTSHTFYSEVCKETMRVRCLELTFNW